MEDSIMYKLGQLIPLESYAMSIPKYRRFDAFMRQATLHSIISELDAVIFRKSIVADLEEIIVKEAKKEVSVSTWIETDEFGSGYDTRFTDISWMDTRDLQATTRKRVYV